jgi:hypothetical protein
MEDTMQLRSPFTAFVLAGAVLTAGGCVTQSDLDKYATEGDLETLRSELRAELQRVQESSTRAEQLATAASESAASAAANAETASTKADYIYQQSLSQ